MLLNISNTTLNLYDMTTPIERLRRMSELRKDRVSRMESVMEKMKNQADAAAKVSQEIRGSKA